MVKVEGDQKVADEKAKAVEADSQVASAAAAEANAIKSECQAELDQALAEYNNAIKVLDKLDSKAIDEVTDFAKPPPLVETVLGAVCLLFGKKETWDEAKKVMADEDFIKKMKGYDKDALASDIKLTKKLQTKYINLEDFTYEKIKTVSSAATCMLQWVKAMEVYGRVARST